jgi:saccharopine dehydrogenase-like NADP-dependent oxidoreductase
MHNVLLLGAGKIGAAAAKLLASTGDYDVLVGDVDPARSSGLAPRRTSTPSAGRLRRRLVPASPRRAAQRPLACSFNVNPGIAQAALDMGASYFDLTEDVATTRIVKDLAKRAKPGRSSCRSVALPRIRLDRGPSPRPGVRQARRG